MARSLVQSNEPATRILWMWDSSMDPFSKSHPTEWKFYSDVENIIIEEALAKGDNHALLDDYHVDLKRKLQISNNDKNKQRPVKRMVRNRNDSHVREERFTFIPVNPKRPFGGLYGWISPFIKAVVKDLRITYDQLLSEDETIIPMIVDKAAYGIVEEAKLIGKQREGEKLAKILLEKKEAEMTKVWECCAYLYSLESFLYGKLNETMRLIGSPEHEQVWRSKVSTLGPFCLLLWNNPSNSKPAKRETILYRGAQLTDEFISFFKDDCLKDNKPLRSFQAFTSCTRKRSVAEQFKNANVLFIMKIMFAFTTDLNPVSEYPDEEEELLSPGVCFTVDRMDFDKDKNKHLIYLELRQQHRRTDNDQISHDTTQTSNHANDIARRTRRDRRRDDRYDGDYDDCDDENDEPAHRYNFDRGGHTEDWEE